MPGGGSGDRRAQCGIERLARWKRAQGERLPRCARRREKLPALPAPDHRLRGPDASGEEGLRGGAGTRGHSRQLLPAVAAGVEAQGHVVLCVGLVRIRKNVIRDTRGGQTIRRKERSEQQSERRDQEQGHDDIHRAHGAHPAPRPHCGPYVATGVTEHDEAHQHRPDPRDGESVGADAYPKSVEGHRADERDERCREAQQGAPRGGIRSLEAAVLVGGIEQVDRDRGEPQEPRGADDVPVLGKERR